MLQNQKIFFLISGVVILVLAAYFYMKMPHTKHFLPLRVCIVALMSGAVGNMIDRIRLDYVIDFLYFELIDFPIFNVADIYVTLSAASLILLILFFYKDEDFDFLASNKRKKEQAGE